METDTDHYIYAPLIRTTIKQHLHTSPHLDLVNYHGLPPAPERAVIVDRARGSALSTPEPSNRPTLHPTQIQDPIRGIIVRVWPREQKVSHRPTPRVVPAIYRERCHRLEARRQPSWEFKAHVVDGYSWVYQASSFPLLVKIGICFRVLGNVLI
jgi:hypothetical protein